MIRATLAALSAVAILAAGISWCATPAFAEEGLTDGQVRAAVDAYLKEKEQKDSSAFKFFWKNGFRWETKDKKFKGQVGGRIQADWTFFNDYDQTLDAALGVAPGTAYRSGFEFRRARLFTAGTLYKYVDFRVEFDFASGNVQFRNVWIATSGLDECFGCLFPDFKFGSFKEPISLEQLTSSLWLPFLERSLPVEAFCPHFNYGVGVSDQWFGDRVTYALGWFVNDTDDNGGPDNFVDGQSVTGRVTWTPWRPCDCDCRVLHVGASARYGFDQGNVRFRSRPEQHLGQRIVDTGGLGRGNFLTLCGELAFVYDRWSLQAEYFHTVVRAQRSGGERTFSGYYAFVSYFLTGPCRNYKVSSATFDRITPCQSWLDDECCGLGAWEIAARYSRLDLSDDNIRGGEVWDATFGLNWYVNPHTRVMFNYVYSDLQSRGANNNINAPLHVFAVRLQVDF
jgi:phosphate-selective porin OprO/OprP